MTSTPCLNFDKTDVVVEWGTGTMTDTKCNDAFIPEKLTMRVKNSIRFVNK